MVRREDDISLCVSFGCRYIKFQVTAFVAEPPAKRVSPDRPCVFDTLLANAAKRDCLPNTRPVVTHRDEEAAICLLPLCRTTSITGPASIAELQSCSPYVYQLHRESSSCLPATEKEDHRIAVTYTVVFATFSTFLRVWSPLVELGRLSSSCNNSALQQRKRYC